METELSKWQDMVEQNQTRQMSSFLTSYSCFHNSGKKNLQIFPNWVRRHLETSPHCEYQPPAPLEPARPPAAGTGAGDPANLPAHHPLARGRAAEAGSRQDFCFASPFGWDCQVRARWCDGCNNPGEICPSEVTAISERLPGSSLCFQCKNQTSFLSLCCKKGHACAKVKAPFPIPQPMRLGDRCRG